MAKLTTKDILKLAELSKLQLTDDEVSQFTDEITSILDYVEQLKNVDLKEYEPTSQVTGLVNVTRPDEIRDYGADQKALLKNAPSKDGNYFKVKRMVQ